MTRKFWKNEGLEHLFPRGFGEFPEGFDVHAVIRNLAKETNYQSVVDFGCGYGRLCESFESAKYLGVDVNPKAIDAAKNRFNNYRFRLLTNKSIEADLFFAYTVFLHLSDRELLRALGQFRCKWVIISEILGREWRREGKPPVFNRDLSDYEFILRSFDFVLLKHIKLGYQRYQNVPWCEDKNTDISFLLFCKKLSLQ